MLGGTPNDPEHAWSPETCGVTQCRNRILALSILVFLWNVYVTGRHGVAVTEEDPWGYCSSLEWATSCPLPRHNFYRIPRIRSERPAFEAHYPHIKWGRESRGLDQKIPATSNVRK